MGEAAARILSYAREHGAVTSVDILAPGDPGLLEWIAPALPYVDYLLPNDEQVLGFTGATDLVAGGRALLERGARCVAATAGAEGALVVDADGATRVPAHEIEVVDTTGCGDAFSAGFLKGLSLGRTPVEAAALGCAAAALVAQGLGHRSRRRRVLPRPRGLAHLRRRRRFPCRSRANARGWISDPRAFALDRCECP
ncbi:carbohydrate kinase family protein [Micromonospora sp. CPCC 206061]|uniref:carbohydrate kinase family protein n=1 Tax=Micromonospora sp. CPCC 206061 TaxID=3122410 RepID=UPI002FF1E3E8